MNASDSFSGMSDTYWQHFFGKKGEAHQNNMYVSNEAGQ